MTGSLTLHLIQSIYDDTTTENGMPTHSTSGSFVLDMFYQMGAARSMSEVELVKMFLLAYFENPLLTTRLMFYNRNIRGGQGERRSFRIFLKTLALFNPAVVNKNLHLIPFYGRWDDLFALYDTALEEAAIHLISEALFRGDGLCAKWMPREGKKGFKEYAQPILVSLSLSRREWRKILAGFSDTVENAMCANAWSEIKYEHIPAKAMLKYRKAFKRRDGERYGEYLEAVKQGTKKIQAGTLYPHELARVCLRGETDSEQLNLQWEALPDFVGDGLSFLPICDVSGSMAGEPLEASIGLGLYLSERNKSVFKNAVISFSARPQLHIVRGELSDRVYQLNRLEWGFNTNLEAVFDLILRAAVRGGATQAEMPTHLLILSDMQFDMGVREPSQSAMEMIRSRYQAAGYTCPQVVFWNLRTSQGVPAKADEQGTALLSGFSPSAMKALLSGRVLDPWTVLLDTLAPYEQVTI
jgi:hypothetical protein